MFNGVEMSDTFFLLCWMTELADPEHAQRRSLVIYIDNLR